MKNEFLLGIITGTSGLVIKTLLQLISLPLLLQTLGKDEFGFYLFLLSSSDLLYIMDLGLTTGLIQRLSTYYAEQDKSNVQTLLCTAQWLYLGLSLLMLIAGIVLTPYLPHLIKENSIAPDTLKAGFLMLFVEVAIHLLAAYYKSILRANCKYHWTNTIETLHTFLQSLIAIILVTSGFGLLGVLISRVFLSIVHVILCAFKAFHIENNAIQGKFTSSKEQMKDLFSVSFHVMLLRISIYLSYGIDDFLIARFVSIGDVAVIGLVRKILSMPSQVCFKIIEGIFPIFARKSATNDIARSRYIFIRLSTLIHFLTWLMFFSLASIYPEVLKLLSAGKILLSEAVWLSLIILAYTWSGIMQMPASDYLMASGFHRFLTVSSIATGLGNFVISFLLVQKLGMVGVLLGTLLVQIVQHQFYLIRMACKQLNISFQEYASTVYLKNGAPLLLLIAMLLICRACMAQYELPLVVMCILIAVAAFISCVVWVQKSASDEERQLLFSKLSPLFGRFKKTLKIA